MKVLVVGKQFPDSFAKNIFTTLVNMGIKADVLDEYRIVGTTQQKPIIPAYFANRLAVLSNLRHRKIVSKVEAVEPDLIIFTYHDIEPRTVKAIRDSRPNIKTVLWYPDHFINWDRQLMLRCEHDVYFFKDRREVAILKSLGKRAEYLPEAMNPMWHNYQPLSIADRQKYGADVAVEGNLYYYRVMQLESLLPFNLNVKIYGYIPKFIESQILDWHTGIFIAEAEKSKMFSLSKVNLNTLHYGEIDGVNCRTFEIAGAGGFQLMEYREALVELFEPDEEVAVYSGKDDLANKVMYFLEHEDKRAEIAEKAYKKAHAFHTYEHRLLKLLNSTL